MSHHEGGQAMTLHERTPLADELRDEREVSQSLREQLIAAEAERDSRPTMELLEAVTAERDELLERHAEFERRLSELDSAKRALKHMTEDRDRLRGLLKGWSPV